LAKVRSEFVCQECGARAPRWMGRCAGCGTWGSLVEEVVERAASAGPARRKSEACAISAVPAEGEARVETGIGELDRVLGGGLVAGSAILIGGDPGIGKSTLLLSAGHQLADSGARVLYVSGEESLRQIRLRGERIGASADGLLLLAETGLSAIKAAARELKPDLLVVDSIQTVSCEELASSPGSVSQVREAAAQLVRQAKETDAPLALVGHVTKEGHLAGPRVLEHMVDTVLSFEGERGHPYRVLRAVKNRFGSTNEIGLFEMKGDGLRQVDNPSEMFLTERSEATSGSAVIAAVEGTRPLLVEVQALVSTPSGIGMPRRTAIGIDPNRVALLVAVLEKKAGLQIASSDVFVNVAGGIRLEEPAADLGTTLALASSLLDRPLAAGTVLFGEVGLAGEVRPVGRADARLGEARKLGFERAVLPAGNLARLGDEALGLDCSGVESLNQALEVAF